MSHQIPNPSITPKNGVNRRVRLLIGTCLSIACFCWSFLAINQGKAADAEPPVVKGSVGMPLEWKQVVIPGSELEVLPLRDDHLPVVLKIDQTWPHGSDFRYDFSFYGLEKGTFDLRDYLRRKDGSPLQINQPLTVTIESVLSEDTFEPSAVKSTRLPEPGGYRNTMVALGVIWSIGLVALIGSMRKRKQNRQDTSGQTTGPTLAEKLEPLVKEAATGTLSKEQQAQLERLLLTYWNQRLDLKQDRPADRIRQLKDHNEAGPLIKAVEKWLHSREQVDDSEIQSLLKPYRSITLETSEDVDVTSNP